MLKKALILSAAMALGAPQLSAQTCDFFGSLSQATFGGTGIPNDAVAVNQCVSGVTLGLTAHARYDNVGPTNDGAGTFYAVAGPDAATGGKAQAGYATWNFAWYVGGTDASKYTYKLWWDLDPVSGNSLDDSKKVGGNFLEILFGTSLKDQDSGNLGMAMFDIGNVFDPNDLGEYQFRLVAYNKKGVEAASTSIFVITGDGKLPSTVPEPATLGLLATGLAGLFAVRRRKTLA